MRLVALLTATSLALFTGAMARAQSPSSVVTPSTTSESVRSTTDAISGAAGEKARKEEEKAKAKAEKAGRTTVPVERKELEPKR